MQSLACWLLYQEGFIEPPPSSEKPYDIFLHQVLSITKGHSGIDFKTLTKQLKENFAFTSIDSQEIEDIINHLIKIDLLEKLQNEVIIGIEGEKIVNSRDFYSVFKTEENFKVSNAGNAIGEIPISPQIREDENILLAAQIWKIKFIDFEAKKIEVIKAYDGKTPMFFGSGASVHTRIREKMFEILYSKADYEILNLPSKEALRIMRKEFSVFVVDNLETDRPLLVEKKYLQLFTFTGTKTNRAISFLMDLSSIKNILDDGSSTIEIDLSKDEFFNKMKFVTTHLDNIDKHLNDLLDRNPALLDFSKWGAYLPKNYQIALLRNKYFDFESAFKILNSIKVIQNN